MQAFVGSLDASAEIRSPISMEGETTIRSSLPGKVRVAQAMTDMPQGVHLSPASLGAWGQDPSQLLHAAVLNAILSDRAFMEELLKAMVGEIRNRTIHLDPILESRLEYDAPLAVHLLSAISAIDGIISESSQTSQLRLHLGDDPENPEWKPIEIRVRLSGCDYVTVLALWDEMSSALGELSLPEDIHVIVDN